ncbi:uncharacterized protein LOC117064658 [Trachypithecus francoisi]|uniref:uncharacterized protein LOC117064658 n=1 Tax=Trachypithecus francoisi TaxID=54180 RepID=UPI00141B0DF8|nr:uncharacterized protein LOC117064658 [Trachypithecus francoisi]
MVLKGHEGCVGKGRKETLPEKARGVATREERGEDCVLDLGSWPGFGVVAWIWGRPSATHAHPEPWRTGLQDRSGCRRGWAHGLRGLGARGGARYLASRVLGAGVDAASRTWGRSHPARPGAGPESPRSRPQGGPDAAHRLGRVPPASGTRGRQAQAPSSRSSLSARSRLVPRAACKSLFPGKYSERVSPADGKKTHKVRKKYICTTGKSRTREHSAMFLRNHSVPSFPRKTLSRYLPTMRATCTLLSVAKVSRLPGRSITLGASGLLEPAPHPAPTRQLPMP